MECVLNDPKHYSLLKDWKVTDEIEIVLHFHDPEFSVGSKKTYFPTSKSAFEIWIF